MRLNTVDFGVSTAGAALICPGTIHTEKDTKQTYRYVVYL